MDFKWFEVLEIQFDSVYDWVRLPFMSEYCNLRQQEQASTWRC